jgi:hypothetical protein
MLSPASRKLNLTAHVTSSVGWLGAVAAFLALSIAGMASDDAAIAVMVFTTACSFAA